jgi:hypothetical protein
MLSLLPYLLPIHYSVVQDFHIKQTRILHSVLLSFHYFIEERANHFQCFVSLDEFGQHIVPVEERDVIEDGF